MVSADAQHDEATGRWVLLHHTGPDGSAHYDWMIAPPGTPTDDPDARLLQTWRVDAPPSQARGDFTATRIADHRCRYLTYEGPLSADRGEVRRVDAGDVIAYERRDDGLSVTIVEGTMVRRYVGQAGPDAWLFRIEAVDR